MRFYRAAGFIDLLNRVVIGLYRGSYEALQGWAGFHRRLYRVS